MEEVKDQEVEITTLREGQRTYGEWIIIEVPCTV